MEEKINKKLKKSSIINFNTNKKKLASEIEKILPVSAEKSLEHVLIKNMLN
jgi:hypothetical protein